MVREWLISIRYVVLLQAVVMRKLWLKSLLFEYVRETWYHLRLASEMEYLYVELMKYLVEHPELVSNH